MADGPLTSGGARLVRLEEVDSTNEEARRRAEAGETGPLWILAGRQTAGRGRLGRAWKTGEGDLAATLLVTTAKPPAEAAQVAFVAALAVTELVKAYVAHDVVELKWPNDVLLDGRKVSGILVESGTRADGRLWLAVGVGVNLREAPIGVERAATALGVHRRGDAPLPDAEAALAIVAQAFENWFDIWQRSGFNLVRAAWMTHARLGRRLTVRLEGETLEGVMDGLDPGGALRLKDPEGFVRLVTAGDVFFDERS